ncbi:hypothetical protein OF830_14000 [Bacillus paramycoides]|nr:hypothetical protein [Bacillus paramycoides]
MNKNKKIIRRRDINLQELQGKLEAFLLKEPSLSLSKIAKLLGYDRKVLMSKFLRICSLIVNRYKEYYIQKKEERSFELIRSIDDVVTYLHEKGVYPSRREVEKFLAKPGLLHEKQIREAWLKKISE